MDSLQESINKLKEALEVNAAVLSTMQTPGFKYVMEFLEKEKDQQDKNWQDLKDLREIYRAQGSSKSLGSVIQALKGIKSETDAISEELERLQSVDGENIEFGLTDN